ncbi:unnamed protein product [Mucor hiemalis]
MFDFLPYTCVNCKKFLSRPLQVTGPSLPKFTRSKHGCPVCLLKLTSNKREEANDSISVPICPICDKPVPVKRGNDPNIRMNQHIQSNCSDLEPKNDNTCRKKGCTTKMLVPMHCPECKLSFCVKHRLEVDHQCQGKPSKKNSKPAKPQSKKDQQPTRADMERQRRERLTAKQDIARLQAKAKQGKITDNEQIQLAKLLSMKDDKKCIVS